MTSQAINCPYCNSSVVLPDEVASGQRISCTRCGEAFAYRAISGPSSAISAAPPSGYSARQSTTSTVEPPVRPFSNRTVALFVVGVMIVMASIALLFALETESVRRAHDTHLPKSKALSIAIIELVALASYVLCLFAAWFVGWNRRERPVVEQRPWSRLSGLFGLFILLQLVGFLGYVTYNARRERPVEAAVPTPVKSVPPAELAALGYLPDDTDLILGIHFAQAQDNAIGKDMLGRIQTGPDELGIQDVAEWTGLKLDDIDHAVLGLRLNKGVLMGINTFVLVVRSRTPIDQEKVQQTLKTKTKKEMDGRTVYPYELTLKIPALKQQNNGKLPAYLWFVDDQTLVVAKNFKPIPLKPHVGCDHLKHADLRNLLKERMSRTAQVWLAGHCETWEEFQAFAKAANAPELETQFVTLENTRTLGIWLTCAEDLTLGAAFDCTDEAAAKALQAKLTAKKPGEAMPLGLQADASPLSRALIDSLKTTQDGTWVQLQARASADAVLKKGPNKE